MNFSSTKLVVIHDNCPDGLASALMVQDALPDAEISFMQYGTPAHRELVPQPGILFVDFTPFVPMVDVDGKKVHDPAVLSAWGQSGSQILDHHKGAKPIVDAFGANGRFGDEATEPGACGAVLVYKHLWMPLRQCTYEHEVERFARLAGIRDTWVRNSPEWDDACRQADVLMFVPRDRWMEQSLEEIVLNWDHHYKWVGEVLEAKQKRSIQKSIEGGLRHTTPKGTRILVFEGVKTTSDVSDTVEDVDLVIGTTTFVEAGSLKMVFSTRTSGSFNCLELCKRYGGGGHTKAAGFSISSEITDFMDTHPFISAIRAVESYEEG